MLPTHVAVEILQAITIRRKERLEPGEVVVMSHHEAAQLLQKAPDRVRLISACTPDPGTGADRLWPVFVERSNGQICTAGVESFTVDQGAKAWLLVQHQEEVLWICSTRLKTKAEFEAQREREGR